MSSRAFRFQAWLQEREGRSFASSENSGRDNPGLVHGSRAARRAVIQEQEARATLYPRPTKVDLVSMNDEPSSGTTLHLPHGTRLGSAFLHAQSWAAYDQITWEEKVSYDPRTGDPKPHKEMEFGSGSVAVFPPVNVPRDGEFGVRRDLVT